MLTKNGKLLFGTGGSSAKYRKINGEYVNATNIKGSPRMLAGVGTTPVTENDYCLVEKNEDLVKSNDNGTYNNNYDLNYIVSFSCTFSNPTEEDIEVSELGCSVLETNYVNAILIDREILNPPVIIPANGGSKTFTVKIG